MRRGKRHPTDDEDDRDKTLVLERPDLDYPLPQPPAEDPTRVHPVAAPPAAVEAATEAPTEALRRRRPAPADAPAAQSRRPPRTKTSARPATARRTPPALAIAIVLAAVAALAIVIAITAGGGGAGNISATVRTDANVRSGPTTNSGVVGSLSAGQHITIDCAKPTTDGAGTWDRLASPYAGRYVASWLVSPAGKVPAC
jgi:hypothetical protein